MIATGHVFSSDGISGISGIAVSDGTTVTRTDAQGRFRLELDPQAEFVFLSLPAGYRIPRDPFNCAGFYRPADAALDFALEPDQQAGEAFSFLYITDMHLDNDQSGLFFSETIADVQRLVPQPAFIVFGGDITLQGQAGDAFLRATGSLSAPCFNAVGNHELLVGEADPKARYKRLFGPTYYSFNHGRCHFVVLDGTQPEPSRPGWKNVIGRMSPRELAWLRQDLALLEPGTPVIVFCHIPIVSSYAERRGLPSAAPEPSWKLVNSREVLGLLEQQRVLCLLQGHMHENEHQRHGAIHVLTSGAAGGKWWRGDNPDGSPRGYRVVEIDGDRYETGYRPTGVSERHMAVTLGPPEQRMGRPARVDVNVFDGIPWRDEVLCRLDGRPAWRLAPAPGVLHQWTGYVPLGEEALRATLTVSLLRDGRELAVHRQELELDPWSPGH